MMFNKFFLNGSIIENISWLMGEKLISMMISLLVSVVIARYLGPQEFGKFNYLLSIIALIAPVSIMGLSSIVTRELLSSPKLENNVIASSIVMRFIGCVTVLIFILILFYTDQLGSGGEGLVFLALGNLFVSFGVIEFWFEAKVLSRYVARNRLIIFIAFSIIKVISVIYGASVLEVMVIMSMETAVIGLSFLVLYRSKVSKLRISNVNFQYGVSLVKSSFWLILSGFASIVYLKIDQVMLGQMISQKEVGVYAVASRISEVWYFLPNAIVASIFPTLIKIKCLDISQYMNKLQIYSDMLLTIALIVAVMMSIIAGPVIQILYGDEYNSSANILKIHIWAGCFVFMRALLSKWLIAENLIKHSLLTHGFGAVINVFLNILLIPILEGRGAAIATVISYAFASYIVLFFSASTRRMAYIMSMSVLAPYKYVRIGVKKIT